MRITNFSGMLTTALLLACQPIMIGSPRGAGGDASGATYELSYVHVVRVRDGLIVSMRDYFDSGALSKRINVVAPT